MKKHFFLLLFAIVVNAGTMFASTQVGKIWYDLDESNKTAKVTYQWSTYSTYSGNIIIPDSIKYWGDKYRVTSIGDHAFADCPNLTSVTIPNSITSIGDRAFRGCTSLTSVTIPHSVTSIGESAFSNCSGLTSITIGERVSSIGNYAFNGCTSLDSIIINSNAIVSKSYSSSSNLKNKFGDQVTTYIIGNNVTSIGNSAFRGCDSLTTTIIGNSVKSIGNYAFENCSHLVSVTMGDSVSTIGTRSFALCEKLSSIGFSDNLTNIGVYAFFGCKGLTYLTFGNSVTSIENRAFWYCSSLTSLEIPAGITSIGDSTFWGCSSLESVTLNSNAIVGNNNSTSSKLSIIFGTQVPNFIIGDSVTSIGDQVFSGCTGMTSVTIPNSVTSIGNSAFRGCTSLTSVTIPNSVTSIGNYAFAGCTGLSSFDIPNGITSIDGTFDGCTGLTSVTIPNSVTIIGNYAFAGCTGFTSFDIPNGITSIGNYAFDGCSGLTSVTIPNSVTSIGYYAFNGCSGLTSVTIPKNVASIGRAAFGGCTGLTSVIWNAKKCADFSSESYSPFYYNRSNIISFLFGNEVEHIPSRLCDTMSKLTSIELPNSVTSIGNYAFYYCTGLSSVELPNSVTSIGNSAFYNCIGLTSVTIGNGVTSIGNSAFNGISSQASIYVSCEEYNRYMELLKEYSSLIRAESNDIIDYSHLIQLFADEKKGRITVESEPNECDSTIIISALPNAGYTFLKWTDGNTNAYRHFKLTADSQALGAIFKPEKISLSYLATGGSNWGAITTDNTDVWSYSSQYGAVGKKSSATGTLFTPIKDMSSSSYVTLSFEHTHRYATTPSDELTLWVAKDFKGNWADSEWQQLTISPYASNTNWTFVSVSINVPIEYVGKNTVFAFRYKSTGSKYATWEIKNLKITISGQDQYSVTTESDQTHGRVEGAGLYDYLTNVELTAVPNSGYHFTQWNDGNNDNPRVIVLLRDTTITAEFEKNSYSVITESANPEWGATEGNKTALYLDEVEISASANYGYHFTQWSDGNTNNPRTIILTQDTSFTATFAKNTYSITSNATNGTISGNPTAEYMDEVTLTAIPDYGYHFTRWSDGNTDNPRTFVVTQDTTFTAEFAINQYEINVSCDEANGSIVGESGSFDYLSSHTYEAIPNNHYHFKQWSDGNTDNPRVITITQDTALMAIFALDTYTISVSCNNLERGTVSMSENSKILLMQASVIERTVTGPIPGSVSTNLSNGKTKLDIGKYFGIKFAAGSLREGDLFVIHITKPADRSVGPNLYATPNTDKLIYTHPKDATGIIGDLTIELPAGVDSLSSIYLYRNESDWNPYFDKISIFRKEAEYLEEVTLTANSEYGYHFTQWSDGNTDNPRAFIITQDTTFTAEFAVDKSGTCGEDNQLTWTYDDETKTLTISGSGALTSNFTYGVEAPEQMQNLIIGNEVTAIGDSAFYGMSTINHLVIGGSVASIGDYAFAECKNFDDITCYATTVPTITENTFANVGNKQYIYLYVPEGRQRAYLRDTYWGEFDIQVKNAEAVTEPTEDVVVTPSENSAEIVWPVVTGAETYEIAITKDNQIVCTLTFNAQGLLAGIAFAPARGMAKQQQVEGFRFTVTGLTSNTQYGYSVVSKDASNNSLDTKSGLFTTTGIATGIDDISSSLQGGDRGRLILLNGQIFILRGDKTYTLTGQEVK